MPIVKGMRLPKLKSQPPVTGTATPLAGGPKRRRAPISHRVTWYTGYIGASSTLPVVSERDAAEIRSFRRDLAMCDRDMCSCVCYCHTGDICDGPIDRVHTPGHKPQHVLIWATPLYPCKEDGYGNRHHHIVHCHDRIDQTEDPRHKRSQ